MAFVQQNRKKLPILIFEREKSVNSSWNDFKVFNIVFTMHLKVLTTIWISIHDIGETHICPTTVLAKEMRKKCENSFWNDSNVFDKVFAMHLKVLNTI